VEEREREQMGEAEEDRVEGGIVEENGRKPLGYRVFGRLALDMIDFT